MTPLSEVWKALVDPKVIKKWSGAAVKMTDKKGKFSLWGGDIFGKNTKVIPEKELYQDWYGGKWDKPSRVVFMLTHKNGCTALYLTQTNVPESEHDSIDKGWDDYYLGKIKELLEK